MRRFQLPVAVAIAHAALMITAFYLTVTDIGRHFPQSPSLLGRVWGAAMTVLGFPLVSGAFAMDFVPFFASEWQVYALFTANSLLWGILSVPLCLRVSRLFRASAHRAESP